jgi:hypothetical protein
VTGSTRRRSSVERVRERLGCLGTAIGLVGGISAGTANGSVALGIYVFLMTFYVFARAIADVVNEPKKLRRAAYFALQPIGSVAVLVLTNWWWHVLWLSAVLGLFLGTGLGTLLGKAIFPDIDAEEEADTKQR